MTSITLHDIDVSTNCYKPKLFMALLDIDCRVVDVDYRRGQQRSAPYLQRNPFGQVPVIEDGSIVVRDSQTILVYLARAYGGETWLPTEAHAMAEVMQWLMFAEHDLASSLDDARLCFTFSYPVDGEAAKAKAEPLLAIVDQHLATRDWLALDRITIADLACYPSIAMGFEYGLPYQGYVHIARWVERIQALPNYIPMDGMQV